jgi:aspartate carbamoyltransferase catalytic subunit
MKNVLSIKQFTDKSLLNHLFKRAAELEAMPPSEYPKSLQYLTLATIFFEPSTRTRLSFETAIQNLGGQLITVENAGEFSSAKKGESLEDTIKTLNAYADGIILRHPEVGSAERAANVSRVPLINAGDGSSEHPTQALLDVYSIQKEEGKIDGLKIALVGDLLHSRTHHSLVYLLGIFDVELFLISPNELKLPSEQIKYLKERKIKFHMLDSWQSVIKNIDVIYINRIQKERFKLEEEYQLLKNSYILTSDIVGQMKENAIILDPLPRLNEIAIEVDSDPRARYFEQVKNGLYIRMALLEYLYSS